MAVELEGVPWETSYEVLLLQTLRGSSTDLLAFAISFPLPVLFVRRCLRLAL